MELQFAELFNLLLASIVVLQSVMIHRSVSREDWKAYLDKSENAAAKTPNTIDDKIAQGQRTILTPVLEKFGIFGKEGVPNIFEDIERKNADNPLVGMPEKPTVEQGG